MAVQKDKQYLILNYNPHVVTLSTKNDNYALDAMTNDMPSSLPFTFDEIAAINSRSPIIRFGLVRFETEHEQDLYEELRISDWQNILTNEQIEDIILHPTIEGLERFIAISDQFYFNRVRGIFMGLRNAGYEISNKIDNIVNARYTELMSGKRNSNIVMTPKAPPAQVGEDIEKLKAQSEDTQKALEAQRAEMEAKLAAQQAEFAAQLEAMKQSMATTPDASAKENIQQESVKEKKPVTKRTAPKKTTNKTK